MKSISKILGFLLLAAAVPGGATAAGFDFANSNCDQITAHMLEDLNKLKMENEQVSKACQQSHGVRANDDHSNQWANGDCALTYSAIRHYIKGIDKRLDDRCKLVKEAKAMSAVCLQRGQSECQTKTGAKFKEAVAAGREASNLLKRARERLLERMEWNEETAYQYAEYLNSAANALQMNQPLPDPTKVFGGVSPDQVLAKAGLPKDPNRLRQAANTITGSFRNGDSTLQLDPYSKEQHNAFLHGKTFVTEGDKLQQKVQRFNAYLNKNASLQLERGSQLGAGPSSSITGGNSPSLLGAAGAGAALGQMAGAGGAQNPGSGSAAYPNAAQAGSQAAALPPDPNDDELQNVLAGRSLSAKELERREGPDEAAILAEDAKAGGFKAGSDLGEFGPYAATGLGSVDLGTEGEGNGMPRGLASVQAKSKSGLGGLNSTGASSPVGAASASAKKDGTKSGDEAFENYTEASGSGVKKPLDRSGPSLRDLLRQKMNGGGASTRVMHDVLGDMQEQVDEGMQRIDSMSGEEEEYAGSEDIKGMDSEPLFVRIRAAHLRYQQVQVSAASY